VPAAYDRFEATVRGPACRGPWRGRPALDQADRSPCRARDRGGRAWRPGSRRWPARGSQDGSSSYRCPRRRSMARVHSAAATDPLSEPEVA